MIRKEVSLFNFQVLGRAAAYMNKITWHDCQFFITLLFESLKAWMNRLFGYWENVFKVLRKFVKELLESNALFYFS